MSIMTAATFAALIAAGFYLAAKAVNLDEKTSKRTALLAGLLGFFHKLR